MVNKKIALLITASLVAVPSAQGLFGLDYFRNPPTTSMQTIPEPTDAQSVSQNDTKITQAVKDAFKSNPELGPFASSVTVNTTNGVVTLTGTVNTQKAKTDFESTATSVSGVNKVVNNLEVKSMT